MKIKLDYGKSGLWIEIPDHNIAAILKHAHCDEIRSPENQLILSIRHPVGTQSLVELAEGKRNAVIVICDITRPVPNKILLPPIIAAMRVAGLTNNQITILIATGTHRPNEGAELELLVGPEIAGSIRCVNHVCDDIESQAYVGTSPRGVPVWLDKTYVEADLRVTLGLIEPHFMAGFSGGRKLVMPGIAALETIQKWHSPKFLEHPNAAAGIIEGNPVHEEALAIAKMAPPDMVVDVTLNEANQITGIFAGALEDAWLSGVEFAGRHVKASLTEPVDIIITTCAGAPLDATFYQAVKGMVGAIPVVKKGGTIIIAAQCAEGVGSGYFRKILLETTDLNQWLLEIQKPEWTYIQDQWEVEMLARVVNHADVICVTDGIEDETLSQCFVTPADTVAYALKLALERHGKDATIAVIPKGPYVIACIQTF